MSGPAPSRTSQLPLRPPRRDDSLTAAFRDEMRTSLATTLRTWKPISDALSLLRLGERVVAATFRVIVQRRFPIEEFILQTWYTIRV